MHRVVLTGVAAVSAYAFYNKDIKGSINAQSITPVAKIPYPSPLPSRSVLVDTLKSDSEEYDILVIGGGATGCGVALDAATRGLKTALVERGDYASGTSSKSTKLIHGGVRYLQKAILKLDRYEYNMVREALHERKNLLDIAPHLATPLPIMLPCYKWWMVPYYWVGIKAYDLVAGRKLLKSSYFIGRKKAIEEFPLLKQKNLCGAIVYYDGQQNDSRMNVMIAMTAIRHGATCVNHTEVVELTKNADGKLNGALVRDRETGDEFHIRAKCVVNAAGPFTDGVRKMADAGNQPICQPSRGTHITLPEYYSPKTMGLLDPDTSDGRIIFILPWQGKTIAGTTDRKCDVTYSSVPEEDEIQFILDESAKYFNDDIQVRREDVLSSWAGIRPLVSDPNTKDTKTLSRNHIVHVADDNLVTIAGGKWTTYRSMAQDTVNAAVSACKLDSHTQSSTDGLLIEGADGWTDTSYVRLAQKYHLKPEVAEHLSRSYGTRAEEVAGLDSNQPLSSKFNFVEGDVRHSCRQEYACSVQDVIARRMRLAFLDVKEADAVVPRVAAIMAEELAWSEDKTKSEIESARQYLTEFSENTVAQPSPAVSSQQTVADEPAQVTNPTLLVDTVHAEAVAVDDVPSTSDQPVLQTA